MLPFLNIEETEHEQKERKSSGAAPRPLKKRKEPEGPAPLTQDARYFNFAQRAALEESFIESNQCPASPGDLVDRLNGLKATDGKIASAANVRKWFCVRKHRTEASKEPEGRQRAGYFNFAQRAALEASFIESNKCPASPGDLVDRRNGLKATDGKMLVLASAAPVRKWFCVRRSGTEASKEPEEPRRAKSPRDREGEGEGEGEGEALAARRHESVMASLRWCFHCGGPVPIDPPHVCPAIDPPHVAKLMADDPAEIRKIQIREILSKRVF
jgi:hypothetical protein